MGRASWAVVKEERGEEAGPERKERVGWEEMGLDWFGSGLQGFGLGSHA